MKIAVVSNPEPIKNESDIMNELLMAGLDILHLRRPDKPENEICKLLENVDERYHDRIVLHQHFNLTEKFNIRRLHFSEANRLIYGREKLMDFKNREFILSTSVHSITDFNALSPLFHYTFIGPVFESISKLNYKPTYNFQEEINKKNNDEIKIFGIGGIDHTKLETMKGFDGAALLGAIWQKPVNATEEFIKCKKIANTMIKPVRTV